MTGLIAQACADAVSVRVVRIIAGVLPAPRRVATTIDADTALTDLGCDALDQQCIAMGIEDEFGIPFPDAVAFGCESVADFIDAVARVIMEGADQ